MDFCLRAAPFLSLDTLERHRNLPLTRRNTSLMGGIFDPFSVVSVDADVLVDRFSRAVFSLFFPQNSRSFGMLPAPASPLLNPK